MTWRLAPLLLLLPLFAGCGGQQSVLDAQGEAAIQIQHLIYGIIFTCSLVWLAVAFVLFWALARSREDAPPPLRLDPRQERRMMFAVIGGVAGTCLVILAFTVASFLTTRALSGAQADVRIQVRALQWWWEVRYLSRTPELEFVTANELHIPVGRTVRIELEGVDVIHSLWLPNLAGKQDLIPGRRNQLTLTARTAGTYRGQCAEFCGLQHAHMALFVIAEEPAAFDAWTARQREAASEPADEESAAGRRVFLEKACAACHAVRGTPAVATNGPDLTHVASRQSIGAGMLETTRGSLAAWIADPQTIKPGNNMPLVPLTPDELRAVSAYMAGLK
jgi:cytochrome c oxidase subunit 2